MDSLRAERSENINKFKRVIDQDLCHDLRDLDNDCSTGKISESKNIEERKQAEY
jgi:hypothetical protein